MVFLFFFFFFLGGGAVRIADLRKECFSAILTKRCFPLVTGYVYICA